MSALVNVDNSIDDLQHADRLLNAAILASFAMKGDDNNAVGEVITVARGAVKVALGRLETAIEEIQKAARAA